ncbi:hypothetical protein Tco_0907816 [Tanacetum coccineum]|uniref:Uncharacterized protein n=1 Tax=Tanacetum coccineum TaxID=301880 RepID=A0ABQ5CNT2_9ASTR
MDEDGDSCTPSVTTGAAESFRSCITEYHREQVFNIDKLGNETQKIHSVKAHKLLFDAMVGNNDLIDDDVMMISTFRPYLIDLVLQSLADVLK